MMLISKLNIIGKRYNNFCFYFRKLIEFQMLEPLVEQVLTNLIYNHIESHIQKTCQDNYDTSHVESLEKVVVLDDLLKCVQHVH